MYGAPSRLNPLARTNTEFLSPPIEDEIWPVAQDEIVQCERRTLSGGECLVVEAA